MPQLVSCNITGVRRQLTTTHLFHLLELNAPVANASPLEYEDHLARAGTRLNRGSNRRQAHSLGRDVGPGVGQTEDMAMPEIQACMDQVPQVARAFKELMAVGCSTWQIGSEGILAYGDLRNFRPSQTYHSSPDQGVQLVKSQR